jgi:hypothetical protein
MGDHHLALALDWLQDALETDPFADARDGYVCLVVYTKEFA